MAEHFLLQCPVVFLLSVSRKKNLAVEFEQNALLKAFEDVVELFGAGVLPQHILSYPNVRFQDEPMNPVHFAIANRRLRHILLNEQVEPPCLRFGLRLPQLLNKVSIRKPHGFLAAARVFLRSFAGAAGAVVAGVVIVARFGDRLHRAGPTPTSSLRCGSERVENVQQLPFAVRGGRRPPSLHLARRRLFAAATHECLIRQAECR
mmetsp:Transcript_8886/g.16340  ORF Transcript_8886/g.16340 Transcript_8886/m.16340 type:complete len:205 (+) Transcript_8886:1182-1796(+)